VLQPEAARNSYNEVDGRTVSSGLTIANSARNAHRSSLPLGSQAWAVALCDKQTVSF